MEARRRCGIPTDRRVVVTVAAVYTEKGQHLVAQALGPLTRQHPGLLYVVVGQARTGADMARLRNAIAAAGLEDRVLLAGPQPHEELPWWFSAADVSCLATQSEGWANVLLESLACGVPVVATRVGGNPEIITDERLGFLVPYGDVPALGEALGRAMLTAWDRAVLVTHARQHSWERAALDVVAEFSEAVGAVSTAQPTRAAARC
jgi:glycosyltransferase involved in cell wall biosynthesis